MTEKYKKLKSASFIILLISFTFLSFLAKVSLAKEIAGKGGSYPGIASKIETTEQKLAEERFKLRLKEANEYMEKGDRYYAAGKLQEALGEWYAALALLDLLQDRGVGTSFGSCAKLEDEIKSRINSEENKADPRRQAQIEKRVQEVLNRRIKEEQAAKKQQVSLSEAKPEEKPVGQIVTEEPSVSLQDLEAMKKNRQAVEEMISQELVTGKEAQPQAKVPAQEEAEASQGAMEASVSQELASDKQVRSLEAAKNEKIEMERAAEQKRLEAKKILAQEESERLKEAQLTKQNEVFKSAAEASIIKKRLDAKKEIQAQEQLKKQAEERIQAQLAQEAKQDLELKAKAEKLESDKIKDLIREKKKSSQVESQLQALEKNTQTKQAKKRIAKKVKQKAKKSSMKQGSELSAPTGGADKFDLIDKVLTSYDYYQDNSYRRD